MAYARDQLLGSLLKGTSRSFYLTLRVLPGKVRRQIGIAYLLARTTDTVADTALVPRERRQQALQALLARIIGKATAPLELGDLARQQGSVAERALLEHCESSLALLNTLAASDLELTRQALKTIGGGQELDLVRFAEASAQRIVALRTEAELDDYTYRVAGCVGEFWTRLCRAHVFPRAALDDAWLLANGVRFGKGLQLVNVLRDLAADLRKGRCYLPEEKLISCGLAPRDLLEASNELRLRPLYDSYLDQARDHLLAGWAYTNALPRRFARVRLACAWPIIIGLKTLDRLRSGQVLDGLPPIKVERREIRRLMVRSVWLYPWRGAWQRQVSGLESCCVRGRLNGREKICT